MIDHMDIESTCVHKDSEEAQDQLRMDDNATGNCTYCCVIVEFGYY